MQNIDALRLAVSSTLVTAARQWRRASHGLLAAYNVSEACAAPLLIAGPARRERAAGDAGGTRRHRGAVARAAARPVVRGRPDAPRRRPRRPPRQDHLADRRRPFDHRDHRKGTDRPARRSPRRREPGRSRSHPARAEPVQCGQARRGAEARRRAEARRSTARSARTPRHDVPVRARLAVFAQDLHRVDAGALHRAQARIAASLLGDGDRVYRLESVRRRDALESALSRARHDARRGGARCCSCRRSSSRRISSACRRAVDGTLLYLAMFDRTARSLRLHAGGLHAAADRAARRDESHRLSSISPSRAPRRSCSASCARASWAARCFRAGSRRRSSSAPTPGFATPRSTRSETLSGRIAGRRFPRAASGSRRPSTVSNSC